MTSNVFVVVFGVSLAVLLVTHFLFRENKTMNRLYLTPVLSAVIIALILSLLPHGSGSGLGSSEETSLTETGGKHTEEEPPKSDDGGSNTDNPSSPGGSTGGSGVAKPLPDEPQDITIKWKGKKLELNGMKVKSSQEMMTYLKKLQSAGKIKSLKYCGDADSTWEELRKYPNATRDNGK